MRTLLVFAKAPRAGEVKTRLASGRVDARGAARLAEAFLRDVLDDARRVKECDVHLCFAPANARAELESHARGIELVPQRDGDLGARLAHAFASSFARGASKVVAIGTDTPHLGADAIERAYAGLDSADVVLGPSADGGYHLIGLSADRPELFARVAWSTPSVLSTTLARAREAKLRVALLEERFDVDRPEDLAALARWLATTPAAVCPHTRAALLDLGLAGASSS